MKLVVAEDMSSQNVEDGARETFDFEAGVVDLTDFIQESVDYLLRGGTVTRSCSDFVCTYNCGFRTYFIPIFLNHSARRVISIGERTPNNRS